MTFRADIKEGFENSPQLSYDCTNLDSNPVLARFFNDAVNNFTCVYDGTKQDTIKCDMLLQIRQLGEWAIVVV